MIHGCAVLLLAICMTTAAAADALSVQTGAQQLERYLPLLKGKRVALIVNQSSLIGQQHLVDVLREQHIAIDTILAPEHGFREIHDAGEKVDDQIDAKTGVAVLSLYGKRKQPPAELMSRIDTLVFDIQDVGVRFYTYLSTLHYSLEACAEANKDLIVLDRPNPNGDYIDGPVLDLKLQSFVGLHPIPVVYGLTLGEMAQMIVGEGWLKSSGRCNLHVITLKNYARQARFMPSVAPSPNLPSYHSIRWYPSLVFFEATSLSIGRGTDFPFEVIGFNSADAGDFHFTPLSRPGAKQPPLLNQLVYGDDLRAQTPPHFSLQPLIKWHRYMKTKQQNYFTSPDFMDKLIGVTYVREMIEAGASEAEISSLWQNDLDRYRKRRQRYLLYSD